MEKLNDVLKQHLKLQNSESISKINEAENKNYSAQSSCKKCQGLGWYYIYSGLDIHHEDFGKLNQCACQSQNFRDSHFNGNLMTFENFNTDGHPDSTIEQQETLAIAKKGAIEYARNPHGWLHIIGKNNGVGKTHLLIAIAGFLRQNGQEVTYKSTIDLIDELAYLRFGEEQERTAYLDMLSHLKQVDFLLIDNLDIRVLNNNGLKLMLRILDARYINRLPTVITSHSIETWEDNHEHNILYKQKEQTDIYYTSGGIYYDSILSRLSDKTLVAQFELFAIEYKK